MLPSPTMLPLLLACATPPDTAAPDTGPFDTGDTAPIDTADTEEAFAKNRRLELKLTER